MSSAEERIQILYEISLSIGRGNGEDLTETARQALSTYLRKLNCSEGAIFERHTTSDGGVSYETVTMIPSRAAVSEGFEEAVNRLPDESNEDEPFQESLPITGQSGDGLTYYLLSLPDFGVLLLVVRGRTLDSETVAALRPLNEKLATACLRERYEARLREERDRFEAVLETIEEPLATVSPRDGALVVQRINPAFETTFGYFEEQAKGRELSSLLGSCPSDDDGWPWPLDGSRVRPVPVTGEIRRETTDGTGEFLFRSAPINPANDQTDHLVLFVDITDEAARKRRLERLTEVTDVLSRILRHNIRNDLTIIKATADRLRRNSDGETADDAEQILERSDDLLSTADNAREMRKLVETHKQPSPVPLQSLLRTVDSKIHAEYPEAEISIDPELPDDITVHPWITIAIRHLVENGIEHYEPDQSDSDRADDGGPHVWISAQSRPEGVRIEVRDNGPGVPDAEVEILDYDGETDLRHGSGAGLWIVSQIIDYCGARLEFTVDDSGTTATIFLDE